MSNFAFHQDGQQPEKQVVSPQFLSTTHRTLFFQHLNQLKESQQTNPEYQSALFIITSDAELTDKMLPYFSSKGFAHLKMFEEQDFSNSFGKIAKVAANLFLGHSYEFSVVDLVADLDERNFRVLLQALIVRRYGVKM